MRKLAASLIGAFLTLHFSVKAQEIEPKLYSVEVSAAVQTSPPQIRFQWPGDGNATGYFISRKLPSSSVWSPVASLPGSATTWTESSVSIGNVFEYQFLKKTALGYAGSGYCLSGINAPPVEDRGRVILLVDNTWSTPLAAELQRLESDLTGDGWAVVRQDISRSATVQSVRAVIQNLYAQDSARTKALFLFGHVPVPYSGDFDGDSHPNHTGAWPTDAYYGDVDGTWTDSTVNDVQAEKAWNHNTPGDGKFDQSFLPSDLELEVGRVDLYYLTCFANKTPARDEQALLRQYLNKDHNFRHGLLPVARRGLVCDNFFPDSEALAATGWRNFAPLFGAPNNIEVPGGSFFSTLDSQGFLCTYADGGGSYYTCNGIGSSDDFALHDMKAVFTFFFGSYFGDWDNESNFLRAPLGSSTYTLTSAWGSRPPWFIHPMALGETIGYAARLSQNNQGLYFPTNFSTRQIEGSLHGDPTLRLHPVLPPSSLKATSNSGIRLSWNASTDSPLLGYYVYRAANPAGPFTRISGASPITGTAFSDPAGTISSVYMVRALKLETSASGTYTNLSQGIFARPANPPSTPENFRAVVQSGKVVLSWTGSGVENGFYLFRQDPGGSFKPRAVVPATADSYTDTTVVAGNTYNYMISAYSAAGESIRSSPITVTVPVSTTASAVSAGLDSTTGGNWKGNYGREGYHVINDSLSYPSYLSFAASGNSSWIWNWSTTDAAALLRAADSTRLAACWYASSPMNLQFSFSDAAAHRVALYFLDWDQAGRQQVLEILNSDTGQQLASQTLQNFQSGLYSVWDLQGRVTLRLRPVAGNAVLSGIFFDSALPMAAAPIFNPAPGTYTNGVVVSLSCPTAGASIRYTTDSTTPGASSPLYTAPLTFSNNVTIKARALKSGLSESPVTTASYTIVRPGGPGSASVVFNGVETLRQGTWKGAIGGQGYVIIGDAQSLPSFVTVEPAGKADWTWQYDTTDSRALQRATDTSRLAACWYSGDSFTVDLNFSDSQPHRVSFYCVDWDDIGRQQKIEVSDRATGEALHSYTLNGFSNGAYLDYTMTGRVTVKFSRLGSYNAVLSGVFFDTP